MNNKPQGMGYTMTPQQHQLVQEDLADRERQASALAAAGMVAETVDQSSGAATPQGLHAPPMLGSVAPLPPSASHTVDGINWSFTGMDLGLALDDMEMDFAKLFDPAKEAEALNTAAEGSSGA